MINLFKNTIFKFQIKNNRAFIWFSDKKKLLNIKDYNSIPLDLLIGIDDQKTKLIENTTNFAEGHDCNSALLWGSRGNGKSTLIKSVFEKISNKYKNLKLIQIKKNDLISLENIYYLINLNKYYRFIIFIDDLSFEKNDNDYKIIKSSLDGSILKQPKNSILYITSNRRHLISREMIDNERSSAIHTDESVEEKISLSDRFGLWLGFHSISQETYKLIIIKYFEYYKIDFMDEDIKEAIQWSTIRGNRNGRTASQFIKEKAAKKNIKINI